MMLAAFILVLILFWLLGGVRGYRLLSSQGEQAFNSSTESQDIVHLFLSSALYACMIVMTLFSPFFLESLHLTSHSHHHNDLLHRVVFATNLPLTFYIPCLLFLAIFCGWVWIPPLFQWYQTRRWLKILSHCTQNSQRLETQFEKHNQESLPHELSREFQGPIVLVPGAWAGLCGTFRPVLLLGRDLVSSLSKDEMRALLAHEESHRSRRDPLFRMILLFCSRLLPFVGTRLFQRWTEKIEKVCDFYAVHIVGDPIVVAKAMIHTRRLQLRNAPTSQKKPIEKKNCPIFTGFTHLNSGIESRVCSLLSLEQDPPLYSTQECSFRFSSKLALLLIFFQQPLHHTLEFFLSLFS